MNYYISDLHLFHEACIKFDSRPFSTLEEMHSTIIKIGLIRSQTYFKKCIAGMKNECRHAIGQDVRVYNVGCMKSAINYTPRTLEEIMDRSEGRLPE